MPDSIRLTDEERYFFDLNGYIVFEEVLTKDELARMNAAIEAQGLPPATDEIGSQRFGGFFLWDETFRRLINHPRVLGPLREIVGEKLRLDHAYGIVMSKGNVGLSLHGGGTPYDPAQYYVCRNGRMYNGLTVAAWTLVDVGPEDGGFCCIPGSHKSHFPLPSEVRHFRAHRDWVRHVPMKAGSVVLFTEALTHGTLPWQADHDRRAILLKYAPGHLAWGAARPIPSELEPLLDAEQRRLFEPPYVHRREPV